MEISPATVSAADTTTTEKQQPPISFDHPTHVQIKSDIETNQIGNGTDDIVFDYARRAQWLRAAVLGANDGLLSTASLMMGVGAVRKDVKSMVLSGVAGLIAGACSMAIGEFVSVYSQYDIEMSQIKREVKKSGKSVEFEGKKMSLPSPVKAAVASASAFTVGAIVPLLAAAFIRSYHARLAVVAVAVSLALVGFGGLSAVLGKAPVVKSTIRVLVGGWLAMGITFGLTKAVGSADLG